MEFNYEFNVPMFYFDLSTQCRNSNLFLTIPMNAEEIVQRKEIENQQEIEEWFLVPHEPPPKSTADDLIFAELEKRDEMLQRKSKGSLENSSTIHGKYSSSSQPRKRSLSDRSSTPTRRDPSSSGLASKPMRNKSLLNAPTLSTSNNSTTANPLKRCHSPYHNTKLYNNENQNVNLPEGDQHSLPEKRRKTSMISGGPSRIIPSTSSISSSSSSSNIHTSATSSSIITRSKTSQSIRSTSSTTSITTTTTTSTTTSAKTRSSQSMPAQRTVPGTKPKPNVKMTTKSTLSTITHKLPATATTTTSSSNTEEMKSLEEMLKEHNAKFAPIPAYEPPMHSFRDVRKWEKKNGRLWSELKPEEREKVNQEITLLKNANLL